MKYLLKYGGIINCAHTTRNIEYFKHKVIDKKIYNEGTREYSGSIAYIIYLIHQNQKARNILFRLLT